MRTHRPRTRGGPSRGVFTSSTRVWEKRIHHRGHRAHREKTIIKKLLSITDLNQLDNYVIDDKIENLNDRNNTSSSSSSFSTTKTTKLAIRTNGKGYPFITENGNIIIDTYIPNIIDIEKAENVIKNIPGVLEVGLFSRKNNTKYYAVSTDGKFSIKSTT